MKHIKIAIDGPAGAGKSTLSKEISQKLGFIYIDTGAMYRAVALKVINNNIDTRDQENITKILDDINISMVNDNEKGQMIFLNGEDVTKTIRMPEVSLGASNVALIPAVRLKLVELQRQLAKKDNVLMDGRDIGTYVLPDADIKIFLTASLEDRAMRRYEEMIMKGHECDLDTVKTDIKKRDENDSGRKFAPLKPAEDAIIIDTSGNEYEQSLEILLKTISDKMVELIG